MYLMKKRSRLLVSVSGGRSSALMAYLINTNKDLYDYQDVIFVYANTGLEHPSTIDFLVNIEKHWGLKIWYLEGDYSKPKGVGFYIKNPDCLDFNGKVFSECIESMNISTYEGNPNPSAPYCSSYLKTRVINAFGRAYFGGKRYVTAIGYRYEDVPQRITFGAIKELENKKIFPLLTHFKHPLTHNDIKSFFKKQPFDLDINKHLGNCVLCWKKSDKNLLAASKTDIGRKQIKWFRKMESKYNNNFFRGNRSISEVLEVNKSYNQLEFWDISDKCDCGI